MKQGNVVLGILAGISAGALLGILFAPDKGSRTRKKILNKGEDLADELQDKYDDFVESMKDKYAIAKQEVEGLITDGKQKVELTKNALNKAL